MDPASLHTAATYVNNLLLARGLLRNGKPVDFASLVATTAGSGERSRDGKSEDKEAKKRADLESPSSRTVIQVINLVHDLILRRDRDQEAQVSLSSTLTSLRTSQSSASSTITRLEDRNNELRRQLELSNAATRAAKNAAHAAEASARMLREDLIRTKNTLGQVRTQCANDVRKRDVEMKRLKKHLSDTQRGVHGGGGGGGGARVVGASCTINTGSRSNGLLGAGSGPSAGSGSNHARQEQQDTPPSLEDAGYSLQQETTEFLTQLSQSMSDENDALIALVRDTLSTLRELMDLPAGPTAKDGAGQGDEFVTVIPTSYDALAADLHFVLSRLQALLTRDDFVPISEVFARDEEILRLRAGWEKIGARWEEAVEMMKSWQERLTKGGDTVNLEELRAGLNLGEGLKLVDAAEVVKDGGDEDDHGESELLDGDDSRHEIDPVADADAIFADVQGMSSSPLASPPVSTVLKEASNNIVSPTTLGARIRKLRLQTSQQPQRQQENLGTGSPISGSSSSSLRHNDHASDVDLDPVKPAVRTLRSTPSRATNLHPIRRPAPSQAQARPSTNTTTYSRTRPTQNTHSKTSTTTTAANLRVPIHKHLNNLLTSSPTSSPEKPSETGASSRRRVPRPMHARAASSSTSIPTSHASSPAKQASARLEQRTARASAKPSTDDFEQETPDDEGEDAQLEPEAPVLSISQKLRHAESEARRVSGFALSSSPMPAPPSPHHSAALHPHPAEMGADARVHASTESEVVDAPAKADKVIVIRSPARPAKTTRVRGAMTRRGRRRKSTLSPDELEELMGLRSPIAGVVEE